MNIELTTKELMQLIAHVQIVMEDKEVKTYNIKVLTPIIDKILKQINITN